MASAPEPAGEDDNYTGTMDAGPLPIPDDTNATTVHTGSVTCTVQVGANSTHADADAFSTTGPTTPGAVALPRTQIAYAASDGEVVHLCTQVNIDGAGTLYWSASSDPLVAGSWSESPTVPCQVVPRTTSFTPIPADLQGTIYIWSGREPTWTGAFAYEHFFRCETFGPRGGPNPSDKVKVVCEAHDPWASGVEWRCNVMTPGAMVFPHLTSSEHFELPWLAYVFELLEGRMARGGHLHHLRDAVPPPTTDYSPRTHLTTTAGCDDESIQTGSGTGVGAVSSRPVDVFPVRLVTCEADPVRTRPFEPLGPYLAACNFS